MPRVQPCKNRTISCTTSTAPSSTPLEALQPASVITQDFIEKNLPMTANYDEAIKFSPSVFDTAPNGPGLAESQNISIRGFQDGQFNVTFDGIPFQDANDFTHHSTSYFMAHDLGLISVDRGPGTAATIGSRLGIEDIVAEVLPDGKAAVVAQLQQEGHIVAMAGDGINDAPALAQAEIGIAMGTGADVAIESAAITLVKGDLYGIVRARHLSRATMRNIRQNLVLAFVYNALGIPLAAGVLYPAFGLLLSPIVAAAAMSFSSVSVIANSLRLRFTAL